MKPCKDLQRKLAAGLVLGADEEGHRRICADCGSLANAMGEIGAAAEAIRASAEPTYAEAAAAVQPVLERMHSRRALHRLAWASAAMLAGIAGVLLVLVNPFGRTDDERPARQLFTLLDEVGTIANPIDDEPVLQEYEDGLNAEDELDLTGEQKDEAEEDFDQVLTGSYQILDLALQNDWL